MPDIKIMSLTGAVIMTHANADVSVDVEGPAGPGDYYVEIRAREGVYEYFGPVVVERYTKKGE